MKIAQAAEILAQLGNETRLAIMRHLVKAGEDGVPVGELQTQLSVPASTLSHHISHLKHAGLIQQRREGTTLYCIADYRMMDRVVTFLTDQCCANAKASRRR